MSKNLRHFLLKRSSLFTCFRASPLAVKSERLLQKSRISLNSITIISIPTPTSLTNPSHFFSKTPSLCIANYLRSSKNTNPFVLKYLDNFFSYSNLISDQKSRLSQIVFFQCSLHDRVFHCTKHQLNIFSICSDVNFISLN